MTIKFSYNNRTYSGSLFECFGLVKTRLSNTTVHHENSIIRLDYLFNLFHLIKESYFLLVPSRSVDDDDLIFMLFEISHTFFGNFDRVSFFFVTEEWALDLSCIHFQLFKGSSSKCVATHQTNSPVLFHVVEGKFGASCCLSTSLESDKHDNVALTSLEFIRFLLCTEHICELVCHSLLDKSS
jgi:hypothetical protein